MAIQIRTKVYIRKNGAEQYMFPYSLRIADVPYGAETTCEGSWYDIATWAGSKNFTLFVNDDFQPIGDSGTINEGKPYIPSNQVLGIDNSELFTIDGFYTGAYDALIFEWSKGNNIYRIEVSRRGGTWSDTEHTDMLTVDYKRNGTTFVSVNLGVGVQQRYYRDSSTIVRVFNDNQGLPWKYTLKYNGNNVEAIYNFYTYGVYEHYRNTSVSTMWNDRITTLVGAMNPYLNISVEDFDNWLDDYEPEDVDDEDPYPDPDDPDDNDSDDPDPDPLPGISAVGTGFATIFTPSLSQLRNLSGLFWNETIFDFFQNLVENISDMFLSLAMVPFVVPAGRTVSVTWLGIDTAVSLTLAAQQFVEFNMGNINLSNDSRIWTSNSALDYSPFSQLGIYLPFVGFRDLDIDDCRGKTMNLKYRIDLLSGECVAIISLNGAVYYQFSGNCLTQIPITNEGMQALVSDAVQVGLAIAAVGSAGGGAAAAEGAAAESGAAGAIQEIRTTLQTTPQGRQLASTTANAVIGGKPMYGKTGSVSGAGGMLAVRQPYLYLKTPVSAIPNYYRKYCGYPCNKTGRLGSFSGYTVVEDIRLNNLVATSAEVSEIYDLLKGGVII